jgi:tetratricopeptide (TPR) repeat protein
MRCFDQFIQESDLDAARKCIDIYESLSAELTADLLTHGSDFAAFPSELNDAEHPIGSQRRYHVLIQLGRTLEERYQYSGDTCDLEYAAGHGEKALAMCRAENTACPTVWVFYADILRSSFGATTKSEGLRMAETLCRDAMSLCAATHPLSSTICHTLCRTNVLQFLQSGDEAVVDEAVRLQRIGLERLPEIELRNKHRHLLRLANILTLKDFQGERQNRDEILSYISEAFRLCPPMHVDRWMVHTEMMWQLIIEYRGSGDLKLLNRAVELGRQALDTGSLPNPSNQANFLFRMAESLQIRFMRVGTNDKDLEESVELYRKALQIIPLSNVNRSAHVDGLAGVLAMQFRSDGDVSHLEEASQLYHHISDIMLAPKPWRPDTMSLCAHILGLCFRETGDISELDQAINLDKEAVAAMRPSEARYMNSALQMVSHLCLKFEMLDENSYLKKAITAAEELLGSLTDGSIHRLEAIVILAKARLLRAIDENSSRDIDLTIEQLLSIKVKLLQSNFGPEGLRALSACYVVKFRHSSAVHAALCARDTIDEALESVHSNAYERFQCLIDAAKLYIEKLTPYYNMDIALKYLSDALGNTHRDVRSKIRGVKHVLDKMETERYDIFTTMSSTSLKLLGITEAAVLLLPRIAFFGIHPYSRLQSLKQGQTVAMTSASHALNLFLPEKALEILEQGRAIFWTHTLRLRSPFDDTPKHLRDQLFSLARRLEKVADASGEIMDQQRVGREIAKRRKESDEFNSLIGKVRCLPGLERFMLPEKYSTLKSVAEKGPVVVLVASSLACHAIVLRSSEDAVSVPLEAVTDKWLVESASAWRSTATEARSALRDGRKIIKSKKVPDSSYTRAEQILRLLWVNVVFPVMKALQIEVR